MYFYSYAFILLYAPIVLTGFFWSARLSPRWALAWLAVASLFFYGFWNPAFVALILASITFNYAVGYRLARQRGAASAKPLLIVAIAANLLLLAYFKYTNFFLTTADALMGTHWTTVDIVLPLGISIFTFTQIAFLCDVNRGEAREYSYVNYLLFVTYFPHLIAGPIIHHKQIMPQFDAAETFRPRAENVAIGLTVFVIGLAKKTLLASSFAEYSDPIFAGAENGAQPGLLLAWTGALAYTLQIYFDFSGYTDMAIGLSRMLGIVLPENFASPYRSVNIIEFWRRWNMTLSQFLRDYLYIPLGGNRKGPLRRHANLMITMLLGGLWHGASWTFVAWGFLHGLYLIMNHAWIALRAQLGLQRPLMGAAGRVLSVALTFFAVLVAWVFFRAQSFDGAYRILAGMTRWHDLSQPAGLLLATLQTGHDFWIPLDRVEYRATLLAVGFGIVWFAPNTRELTANLRLPGPVRRGAVTGACLFFVFMLAAVSASRSVSGFIYFNF